MINDTLENRRKALEASSWFATYAPDALDFLSRNSRLLHLPNGAPLASRTDPLNTVAVVVSGGLRSTATSSDGYEYTLSFLRRGAFMGAISLIDRETNPLDVSAAGETVLLTIRTEVFRAALKQYPSLYEVLVHVMAYRLRKAYALIQGLALDPIETRLKRALISMAEKSDPDSASGTVRIRITQDELGHLIRSTRPTVNRILKKLEQAGMVMARYGHIEITDLRALREACDDEPIYSE